MLFVADPLGRIIAANSNSLRILGYKRSDLEGKPIELLIPLALRDRHLEHVHHYFSHPMGRKMGSGLSLSILDADGRDVPIDIELWPFSSGEIQYVLTICRSLDEDIARRQMHIHALVETARDYAVNLLDDEGRILTWNEGAERMYGLTSAEALGQNYSILFPPSQRTSNDPGLQLAKARKSRNASEIACWRRLADGSDIWAEIRTSASRDAAGAVIGFIHVLHDATEHKRIEEDLRIANQSLRESAAQLENRVQERTAQLEATVTELSEKKSEVELYADRIAQDLKEKEVLLREIHHRVKNNLQVVQSLLKMRARTLQTSDAREAIESAIQRVQVIASVHENLYQMPNISQLPLSAYIKDVVEGAVNSGTACADQIEVKTEADDLPISIDVAVPLGLLLNELS